MKLPPQPTVVKGVVDLYDASIDLQLTIWNNKDTATNYSYDVNLFGESGERNLSYSHRLEGGSYIYQGIFIALTPQEIKDLEEGNLKIGIMVYEDGSLAEERIFHLAQDGLPFGW